MQRLNYVAMGVLVIAGCASSQASREPNTLAPAATSGTQMEEGMHCKMACMCPMQMEGTAVAVEDVDGGVAITFTTTRGDVAELRRRVAHIAQMHGKHGVMMATATARSEEVEGGARLVLTPQDVADLEKLREHARHKTERMSSGECPMMSMQGEAAEPPPASSEDHESHHPAP